MGLFGLFYVAFGLGVITKDAISESISDSIQREKAEKTGRKTYLVNGYRLRSTKTGRDAYMDYGSGNRLNHVLVIDSKTKRIIEDVTNKENAENQIKEKEKAKAEGSVFYRTTEFDSHNRHLGIYVCDTIPGYFGKNHESQIWDGSQYHYGIDTYTEGEVERISGKFQDDYRLNVPLWKLGQKTYYKDGDLREEVIPDEKRGKKPVYYDLSYYLDSIDRKKRNTRT